MQRKGCFCFSSFTFLQELQVGSQLLVLLFYYVKICLCSAFAFGIWSIAAIADYGRMGRKKDMKMLYAMLIMEVSLCVRFSG